MAVAEEALHEAGRPKQKVDFRSGNEMAAIAGRHINFHVMGYYPITPSTEIAEYLDEMKAEGEHDIVMIPGDGEHGAAGICYGAATAGARVVNATSANGLMFALEQLPVQSGTRMPMVLNLVTRSISGPLNIHGDHSDLYFAIHTGWIVLLARDPQAVYDMNVLAVKIGEHPKVRLPVIVAYDGFFTSHQKRRVQYFEDAQLVRDFLGERHQEYISVDPRHPVSIGPYMNEPDFINNKYQLKLAFDEARQVIPEIFAEWARLTGRSYPILDTYRMEDAEVALFLVNSAAETAKDVADTLREQGIRAGVISPNVLRPFPAEAIRQALKNVKAVVVGERADTSYGQEGSQLTHEIKSALRDDPENKTLVLSRVYGLGGKEFYPEDARALFDLASEAAKTGRVEKPFDYVGVTPGDPAKKPVRVVDPLTKDEVNLGLVEVTKNEETGRLEVKVARPRELTARPKRLVSGHGACPGCGIFSGVDTFLKGIEGDVVVLYQTGCAYVTTTGYPSSAHRVSFIHNLFQNGAPTLAGALEAFKERQRRGELPPDDELTFIMITGDGGMDIGMGPALGTALRNHRLIILEYDNQGYMNTGAQLSYSTPYGHRTSTSNVGPAEAGKAFHHKDTAQIMAATRIPYVFTGSEAFPQDLVKKAAKAQYYATHEGMAYGKLLISCPLNWRSEERLGTKILEAAVNSCFFPLYEVEHGITTITHNPEQREKKVPVSEWLKMMGKTRHLLKPEHADMLEEIQREVDFRWEQLKAKHESPIL